MCLCGIRMILQNAFIELAGLLCLSGLEQSFPDSKSSREIFGPKLERGGQNRQSFVHFLLAK